MPNKIKYGSEMDLRGPLSVYAGKNIGPVKRDKSVMDEPILEEEIDLSRSDALSPVDILGFLPFNPTSALGKLMMATQAMGYSGDADAAVVQKMLQGLYRGYSGNKATPVVQYHGGTYNPGDKVSSPLYLTRNKKMAESYARTKGSDLKRAVPEPKNTASERFLNELAERYVPKNIQDGYTPASALDQDIHGDRAVGRLMYELGRPPFRYDSVRAHDIGFDGSEGEALVMLPGSSIRAAPIEPVFATPQRRVAEYYANKRAVQSGEDPHVEMVMVDPFAGRKYGHAIPTRGDQEPIVTQARELSPDDVESVVKLYSGGGNVESDDGLKKLDDEYNRLVLLLEDEGLTDKQRAAIIEQLAKIQDATQPKSMDPSIPEQLYGVIQKRADGGSVNRPDPSMYDAIIAAIG